MELTSIEKSLLLYLETCVVDNSGALDARKMNSDDFEIAEKWNESGFIKFGRIASDYTTLQRNHWCEFSEEAWTEAHNERKARAVRLAKKRFENRYWLKTIEIR